MCGTASRIIFEKLKILRSSGGWSTHGVALPENAQCAKVNQFYLAFAYISFHFSPQFAFYLVCFALLNFYFAFYYQFALLLQISYLFFHFNQLV